MMNVEEARSVVRNNNLTMQYRALVIIGNSNPYIIQGDYFMGNALNVITE
jgi:hypothetical protein